MRNANVSLIGAPTDIGAGTRGASMGPEALRVAQLARVLAAQGMSVVDRGNLAGGRLDAPLPGAGRRGP